MKTKIAVVSTETTQHNDDEYEMFLAQIRANFATVTIGRNAKLFTTDAVNLFDAFLSALPVEVRQHYTCNACRRFVDTFGGLVFITAAGETVPAMWPEIVPRLYQNSVNSVKRLVTKAKVTGVFLNSQSIWGQPETGQWHHIAVVANGVAFRPGVLTASQVMAEKKEDYKTLTANRYPLSAVEQAITLLKTDSLYRSEKCLGVAEWYADLHRKWNATKNQTVKNNLTWLAVATAPAGYCHIGSSMIGTLLEDIVGGLPFESISRRFTEKMHPLQYQRPQAPPTAGNIAQAEKIFTQLKASGSLARRFARLDEIKTIWRPSQPKETPVGGGIFANLKTKGQKPEVPNVRIPAQTMTWVKFNESVLPTARNIELYVSTSGANFAALVTAVNQDAPPILQWDFEDSRNPISWYVYNGGSSPAQWGLAPGYCKVTGICYKPSMWNEDKKLIHQGEAIFLLLDGAKDARYQHSGIALFPETLKSEFHGIRATIEAYSRSATLEGIEDATANGLGLDKGKSWNVILRVDGLDYKLDRWD